MEAKDILGIGIFLSAAILTAVLLRVRFVRRSPALVAAFLLNPALVGVLAACAFWLRDSTASTPCWIGSMVLMVPSTILIAFKVPKAIYQEMLEKESTSLPPADSTPPED